MLSSKSSPGLQPLSRPLYSCSRLDGSYELPQPFFGKVKPPRCRCRRAAYHPQASLQSCCESNPASKRSVRKTDSGEREAVLLASLKHLGNLFPKRRLRNQGANTYQNTLF